MISCWEFLHKVICSLYWSM